jgi:hypothetical protein
MQYSIFVWVACMQINKQGATILPVLVQKNTDILDTHNNTAVSPTLGISNTISSQFKTMLINMIKNIK